MMITLSFDELRELERIDRGEDETLTAPSYRLIDLGLIRLDDMERPHITPQGAALIKWERGGDPWPLFAGRGVA